MLEAIAQLAGLLNTVGKKFFKDWDESKIDHIYSLVRAIELAEASDKPDMNYLDAKKEELKNYVKTYRDAIFASISSK